MKSLVLAWTLALTATCAAAETELTWTHHSMASPASGKIERFWVGHRKDLDASGTYPVVYFLPGLLGTEHDWKRDLGPHLAKYEMIAVCPSVGGATWYMNAPAQPWMKWGDFLTVELREFVEATYPASRVKGRRGITGISSGGHGAFYHAVTRDLYGAVSVLSGAMELRAYAGQVGLDYWIGPRDARHLPRYTERSCLVLASKLRPPLGFELLLDVGDTDGARPQMEALKKLLADRSLAHEWHGGQGGHNAAYWSKRVPDHLAWFAGQFKRNREEGRFPEKTPLPSTLALEPATPPTVAPSEEAKAALAAPWQPMTEGREVAVSGLRAEGSPLERANPERREVAMTAPLAPVHGHKPQRHVYQADWTVATPLAKAGTVTLETRLRNGRNQAITTARTRLAMPPGQSNRRVPLRVRIVVEIRPPGPLRGGIVVAVQPIGADGKPAGSPAVAAARPGTVPLEKWPLAARANVEWRIRLADDDLPLAAVYDARLRTMP